MVTTLPFLIILTELIETEFDAKDDTFNKVRGKKLPFVNSGK